MGMLCDLLLGPVELRYVACHSHLVLVELRLRLLSLRWGLLRVLLEVTGVDHIGVFLL